MKYLILALMIAGCCESPDPNCPRCALLDTQRDHYRLQADALEDKVEGLRKKAAELQEQLYRCRGEDSARTVGSVVVYADVQKFNRIIARGLSSDSIVVQIVALPGSLSHP